MITYLKNLWQSIRRRYWNWRFRHIPDDVCCCGGMMPTKAKPECEGGFHCCRSHRDYIVSNKLNSKGP